MVEEKGKEKEKQTFFTIKNLIMGLAAVVLAGAVAAAVYFYLQYYQTQQLIKNPTLVAAEQTKDLLGKVGALMDLPTDETPQIATVTDATQLKTNQFFSHAQNGDKVLIYTKARKAILYRPSENKIIDVAPVNIGASPTVAPTPTTTAKRVTPKPTAKQ